MEGADQLEVSLPDERRYRLLVDAITDYAVYMLDVDGHVTSWNTGARRFKGYEPADIIGHHFSRFYTEEDLKERLPWRALETATRKGRFEGEGWHVRKDGSRFWAHVIIDPIRDPSGRLIGFAKITRDLTERREAENALRHSQEQFRLLVQGVTDYAIYMLDPDGRVTSWNSGAQKLKGYTPDEIIGEHFSRFYTDEDRAAGLPWQGLETAAREGRFEKEGWRVRKDGTRFWANAVIDAIPGEDGRIIGFAKITRDITERREAQRALDEAREALFQSQKIEAIGRLTGGIAHDFNNLLMAVLGSLELVRKRLRADSQIMALIDNAIQGAERGAALTQRMLAFARRQSLNPESVDVPALVHGMMGLMERSIGPSTIIETDFPPALAPVQVDANQLESAILNLTVNARDAMPDGGRIVIAAREKSVPPGHGSRLAAGRYIRLSVTDNGEGMDEETLAKAMEPFFTTKGLGKGTGLGLSMVHGLAEQSGGRLILKSQKGEGTLVELWLPMAETAVGVAGTERRPAGMEQSPQGPKLVVLAVDDDSLVLMNTVALLEDMGHKVFEATSAREALDLLRRETVDLVISDQAMPQMTGTQLAAEIRTTWPELPIILATGYAELPSDSDPGLLRLLKPFRQEDLRRSIARATKQGPFADPS